MHHYPFHLGDYIRKTAHLSLEEDAVYRRLLDMYYESEQPIPNETHSVIRRLRLGSNSVLLEPILREFFTLEDDNCWHQKHCDEVISNYQHQVNVNRNNGKLGGRPPRTESKPTRLANGKRTESEKKGNQEPITNNQEPLTINQEPKTKTNGKSKTITPSALLASLEISEDLASDFIKLRAIKKAPITKTAINGIEREAKKAGITLADAIRICCERGWAGFKADWMKNSGRDIEAEMREFCEEGNTIEGEFHVAGK